MEISAFNDDLFVQFKLFTALKWGNTFSLSENKYYLKTNFYTEIEKSVQMYEKWEKNLFTLLRK